ncbi:unnamed protein product [Paramecium octaurelia]|uniref:Uncharacterized protein n=1 Tax=Paramecium octaurelia TaxID=43137 RepID=A0A8S1SXW7_PAROT|nr:unnamed protein product [Paramecium octaurelia]
MKLLFQVQKGFQTQNNEEWQDNFDSFQIQIQFDLFFHFSDNFGLEQVFGQFSISIHWQ